MGILNELSSSRGERSETANIELAERLAASGDSSAVAELAAALCARNKAQRSDCIKVLYELGSRRPELIADYLPDFLRLLEQREQRLVWGAMCAIDALAPLRLPQVHDALPRLLEVMAGPSVIARDHGMAILLSLAREPRCRSEAWRLYLAQLESAPENQLPMYAEMALAAGPAEHAAALAAILQTRCASIASPSKLRRVEKVLARLARSAGIK